MQNCVGRGWMDETYLSVFHSSSNRACGRRSRNSISSRYAFNSFFFFFQTRDCTTFTLQDFYIESMTAHRIKRNDHSCFHNSWPNSKSKLKLKHRWEQGCFGGPMQPAYSAYREDRLWYQVCPNLVLQSLGPDLHSAGHWPSRSRIGHPW